MSPLKMSADGPLLNVSDDTTLLWSQPLSLMKMLSMVLKRFVKVILKAYNSTSTTQPTTSIYSVIISPITIRMFWFMVLCLIQNLCLLTLLSFLIYILIILLPPFIQIKSGHLFIMKNSKRLWKQQPVNFFFGRNSC